MSLILEFQSTDQGGNGISAEYHHGIITKAVGGIYYVDALSGFEKDGRGVPDGTTFKCAARGLFRKNEISPSAGDNVIVECQENHEPLISKILERRNYLVRPPLANLDGIVFVISCADPAPNRFVLDKLIAIADSKQIEPMIAFTKPDLQQAEELAGIYRSIAQLLLDAEQFADVVLQVLLLGNGIAIKLLSRNVSGFRAVNTPLQTVFSHCCGIGILILF